MSSLLRSRRALHPLAALLLSAPVLAATPTGSAGTPEPQPLLRPSYERMDTEVREVFEAAHGRLDALLAQPSPRASQLAAAYGELGDLYLVYSLPEAAESAFDNARHLEPSEFRWPYLLGSILQRRRDFDAAQGMLQSALAIRSGDAPATLRLAQVDYELGRSAAATKSFNELLAAEGYAAAAHYGLGRIAADEDRHAAAIGHFTAAVEQQPRAGDARHQLGLAYRRSGDPERARQALAGWGRTKITFPDPLMEQLGGEARGASVFAVSGSRARARGDLAGAAELYRRAVDEQPDEIGYRRVLASVLVDLGSLELAMSQYSEILRLDPDDASTLYNLGTALARRGRLGEAERHLRHLAEIDPAHADARINLAAILEESGDLAGAEQLVAEAQELEPYDLELQVRRSELLTRSGRPSEAVAVLTRVVRQDPADAAAQLALGDAHLSAGDTTAAHTAYSRVLQMSAGDAAHGRAHFAIAGVELSAGRPSQAVVHLTQASELVPGTHPIVLALANALASSGDYASAADSFGEALRIEPLDAETRFHRGVSLLLAGSDRQARSHLEESLRLLPDSLPLQHLLARLLATSTDASVRDGEQALAMARQVFERQQSLDHAETIAMAHAELDEFAAAIEWQQQVIQRAASGGDQRRVAAFEARRRLYEKQEKCRAPWRQGG